MVADKSTTSSPARMHTDGDALLDRFQRDGMSVSASGNQPLLLGDPATAWLVAGAALQVFAVRLRDGVVDGARLPVMRVQPGSVLFGHEPLEISGQPWALMAVGRGNGSRAAAAIRALVAGIGALDSTRSGTKEFDQPGFGSAHFAGHR